MQCDISTMDAYMAECIGIKPYKRIFLLDALNAWTSDDAIEKYETMTNSIIIKLEPLMTPFIQMWYVLQ